MGLRKEASSSGRANLWRRMGATSEIPKLGAWRGKKSPSAPVVIGTAVAIVDAVRSYGHGRDRRSDQDRVVPARRAIAGEFLSTPPGV
jgi:hypothetical protein